MIDRLLAAIPPPAELARLAWLSLGWGCVLLALLILSLLWGKRGKPDEAAERTAQLARDLQTLVQQREGYRRQCVRLAEELRAARLQAGYEAAERAVLRVQLALFRKE